jgi:hypothetical protein
MHEVREHSRRMQADEVAMLMITSPAWFFVFLLGGVDEV